MVSDFFFFNDTATTEIYTLSLHDALPICGVAGFLQLGRIGQGRVGLAHGFLVARIAGDQARVVAEGLLVGVDRKSTRLNSSHGYISYAVFCLKKKKPETRRARSCQSIARG